MFLNSIWLSSTSICNERSCASAARLLKPLCCLRSADTKTRIKLLTIHIYCLINAPLWIRSSWNEASTVRPTTHLGATSMWDRIRHSFFHVENQGEYTYMFQDLLFILFQFIVFTFETIETIGRPGRRRLPVALQMHLFNYGADPSDRRPPSPPARRFRWQRATSEHANAREDW